MNAVESPAAFVRSEPASRLPPPPVQRPSLWQSLFSDLGSVVMTLGALAAAVALLPKLFAWGLVNAVWSGGGAACTGEGACWAFIGAKLRQILFGIYPPDEQWRPMLVVLLILLLTLWSLPPRNWNRATVIAWLFGVLACLVLMGGGVFGLEEVPTASWGGLPLTLLLALSSLGLGFPLATLLAVGRRANAPVHRYICIGLIELVRGLPLISILFIASILLPLLLPDGVTIDKLARALVALTLFSAAYLAEVLRGGLQAIPPGQVEAAHALGLGWLQTLRLIILPQAIRKVIPPLTNTAIVMVKNTSLVLVIGLFDLLSASRAAAADPAWPSPHVEAYLFIAAIYFIICFSLSRYADWTERRLAVASH